MPPNIALVICLLLIACIIYFTDNKQEIDLSWALMIPLTWMCVLGTRNISLFFNMGGGAGTPDDYLEGSPTDRLFFAAMILVGLIILLKRNIVWSNVIIQNKWIFVLFLYYGVSIFWSDFPIVSFKRYIKNIGNIVMVLVVLSDKKSENAFNAMLKRFGYILLPLSVIFYKYFPELGRIYHRYTGQLMVTGVTTNKNALGAVCLVSSIYLFWNIFIRWKNKSINLMKFERYINVIILFIGIYLLVLANSSTSDVCLIIGIVVILIMELKTISNNINRLKAYIYVGFCAIILMSVTTYEIFVHSVVNLTGHQETFWDRVSMWPELIKLRNGSDLFGTGYDSYWLGERLEILWSKYGWRPTEAHNGYVEIFLELGIIGLTLYFAVFISCLNKILRRIAIGEENAKICLVYFIIVLFYNITESGFKGLHVIWFLFLLVSMEYKSIENKNDLNNMSPNNWSVMC